MGDTVAADFPLDQEGVWCDVHGQRQVAEPALFLDRDGVLVEETGYLSRIEDIKIIPGGAALVAQANRRGIPVIVVTNQAGIGRGYFGWQQFRTVQDSISASFADENASFDAVFACAHHAQGKDDFAHPNHPARKPNPGMITRAAKALTLDLSNSWLVGDKLIDVQTAKNAGLAGAMLVLTGYGATERDEAEKLKAPGFQVAIGKSIADAVTLPIFRKR